MIEPLMPDNILPSEAKAAVSLGNRASLAAEPAWIIETYALQTCSVKPAPTAGVVSRVMWTRQKW